MAYATPEQLKMRYDSRILGDLVGDDGNRVPADSLSTNSVILEALDDASGQIRSAALVANKYTDDNLTTLRNNQDPFLVRLTCGLAMGFLVKRRGVHSQEYGQDIEQMENWLAALRLGERIFNIQENADAGNPHVTTISLAHRQQISLLGDNGRFFPRRRQTGTY